MSDLRSASVPPPRASDHVRGPQEAPLVVVYADFTCPRCAVAHARLSDQPLRVAFRHFALRAKHARAVALGAAVEAAGRQGAFWALADLLYADQGRTDDPHLWAHVERLGLDLARFEEDRRADDVLARVRSETREGMAAGVTTTPTLFVDGVAHPGAPSAAWVARLTHR